MPLLSLQDATLAFGGPPLLDSVSLHVEAKERIAVLGRNGAGKSTMLRVLAGDLPLDRGERVVHGDLRITALHQEVPRDVGGSVFDVVAGGLAEHGALLAEVHHLNERIATAENDSDTASLLRRLETAQSRLDAVDGWNLENRVETALSRLRLPEDRDFGTLSGGLKRRVLLARALAAEPDVLLLDEPTNHLDIPAIEWLEELLTGWSGAVVLVTHDRSFLADVATRIVELDRGRLTSYPGDYRLYLERREAELEAEARAEERQDRKLAEEERWVRQGIKARRTRNEGRVRALERLREEVRQRRRTTGTADLRLSTGESSGKIVLELADVGFRYPDPPADAPADGWVFRGLTTTVSRGDKVGILGPNGSGKTTLLKVMLGDLEPTEGTVRTGTRLEVAFFDQLREQLDESLSVRDAVADGNDRLEVDGSPIHVLGYLQRFLFSPEQARSPVSSLSGGERNRLLLARLFTRRFNVLVMDEPTNDLDIETLELLEERLVQYDGTLLLVSHDRAFLDNVVTSTLVMEGAARVGSYAGGYSDWLLQRPTAADGPGLASAAGAVDRGAVDRGAVDRGAVDRGAVDRGDGASTAGATTAPATPPRPRTRKLSYREQRDLDTLPGRIEELEERQGEIHRTLAEPETWRGEDPEALRSLQAELTRIDGELEQAYERWAELEES